MNDTDEKMIHAETAQDEHLPAAQAPAGVELQDVLPEITLADLPEKLRKGAAEAGWPELMPVQAKAIPYLFSQRDMMIQSRTGSGKTGAYLLPMLEMINPLEATTQALVLVPTRELAHQVAAEAEVLGRAAGVRCIAVYGGVGYNDQLDAFRAGAHIVVGTPGRVLDHLLRRSLSLDDLKFLVFDEADRMLSMGFYPDMRRGAGLSAKTAHQHLHVLGHLPAAGDRPGAPVHAQAGFHQPEQRPHPRHRDRARLLHRPGMDKDRSLVRIIEVENPPSALIFCNTKVRVDYVTVGPAAFWLRRGLAHLRPGPGDPRAGAGPRAQAARCASWWPPTWPRAASTCPSFRT